LALVAESRFFWCICDLFSVTQPDQEGALAISQSLRIMEPLSSTSEHKKDLTNQLCYFVSFSFNFNLNNQLHHYHDAIHKSNFVFNNIQNNFDNSNNKSKENLKIVH
jgi:hypothetical protein